MNRTADYWSGNINTTKNKMRDNSYEVYSQFSKGTLMGEHRSQLNRSSYDMQRDDVLDKMQKNEFIPPETFDTFVKRKMN